MAGINQSGIYINTVVGELRPEVMCLQMIPGTILGPRTWNLILPEGHSDIEQLAGSCPAIAIEPSGYINFGSGLNVVNQEWASRTASFIFVPRWDDNPVVTENTTIFKMRLWMDDTTAFSGLSPQPYIQMLPSGVWRRNLYLPSGAYGAYEVPSSLPEMPNISRIDGAPWMSGVGHERTQIIYSSIIFPSGIYDVGRYGGLGSNNLHWRFTYDWTDKDAHIQIGEGSGRYTDY